MAKISNPRKTFNFTVEVDGLNAFLVQKVSRPDIELEVVAHGDTNHDAKTAGRMVVGELVLEKLKQSPQSDKWAMDWMMTIQDPALGGGDLPMNYLKTVVIRELDTTGTVVLNSYIYEGCFPSKIAAGDLDRNSSDNIIETVTLAVTRPRVI